MGLTEGLNEAQVLQIAAALKETSWSMTVALVCVGVMLLLDVIRLIAPRTATTVDDRIVAAVDSIKDRQLLMDLGDYFWTVAEAMSRVQNMSGPQKLAAFMLRVREAYRAIRGAPLTVEAEKFLEAHAAGMSAQEKLERQDPPGAHAAGQ